MTSPVTRGRGRPRLPTRHKRKVFTIRVSEYELGEWERAAKQTSQPIREWMRNVLTMTAYRQNPTGK